MAWCRYGAPFVGYGGGWVGGAAVMRPAPGYLADWQYAGYGSVPPAYHSYNAPYYTHPPPAHHQQVTIHPLPPVSLPSPPLPSTLSHRLRQTVR